MRLLYNFSIRLFGFAIHLSAPFNEKSSLWVKGRKDWEKKLQKAIKGKKNLIWFHCSSLGEFEQGRPVIEALEKKGEKILLTFFSPSGYENLKNYKAAYHVCYLPLDTLSNAKKWLELIQPKAVFFIKYEFWFNYLHQLKSEKIPFFLISGIFRKNQYFFKWYGSWFAKQLNSFSYYFVQDQLSKDLLQTIQINSVIVSGDTRFDRVSQIARRPKKFPEIEKFTSDCLTIIAGSTWLKDEEILAKSQDKINDLKLVIVPHEVNDDRISEILQIFKNGCLYSKIDQLSPFTKVLIIDKIGMLSTLYKYGQIAYIGGGFNKGIHNTLEAAVFGLPLVFGPNYLKFREAREMIELNGAFSIDSKEMLTDKIKELSSSNLREQIGNINSSYVKNQSGGTDKILSKLNDLKIL